MSKKKILIIDDDGDFIESTKVVLETKGYHVSRARSKKEGLEKVKEMLPDLIIMDVIMDKMSDGFDLSRELKRSERYKNIPILIVTALGEKTGFKYSVAGGDKTWLPIDDYADKPLSPDELISKVYTLLKKNK